MQVAEIRVVLARANKDNGLSRDVGHAQSRSHLVVDGVKFGQHDTVNQSRLCGA